jgi:hypothetical protein
LCSLCRYNERIRKKAHFPPQHKFFYQKNTAEEKNYELLLPHRCFFSPQKSASRENSTENITMSAAKNLRLRNSIAEEFVGFSFFRKKGQKKIIKHSEEAANNVKGNGAMKWNQDLVDDQHNE